MEQTQATLEPEYDLIELSEPQAHFIQSNKPRNLFMAGCFVGDTPVYTSVGFLPIAEVKAGMCVMSVNNLTEKSEFREVLKTFSYSQVEIRQKIITFVLSTGERITCTENHEFYDGKQYVRANVIARRAMEASTRNGRKVLYIEHGQVVNNILEGRTQCEANETSVGRAWILENCNQEDTRYARANNKSSQSCSTSVHSQPTESTPSKSQEWHKNRQFSPQPGMGYRKPKLSSLFSYWIAKQQRKQRPNGYSDRREGFRNKKEVQTTQIHSTEVSGGIRSKQGDNTGYCIAKNLDTHLIEEIHLRDFAENELVYDLCVDHNHNYTVGFGRYHVHNSGAGKSHCAGVISGQFIKSFPKIRGFIGANTHEQLSKSTLDRIYKVWAKDFGMVNGTHFVVDRQPPPHYKIYGERLKDYRNVISFVNGHCIFVSSLENYTAIDGTEFNYALLDETKDTREEAVKNVITFRLRAPGMWIDKDGGVFDYKPEGWSMSFNPLYILTSPAKVQWINEWFELDQHYEEISEKIFSEDDFYTLEGNSFSVVISSTYHNRHNLSDGFIENTISSLAGSPHLIEMNIYGSPIAKSGGEFIHQFKRLKHVAPVKFKEGLPTHLSLDFNVRPYMTGLVAQVEKMPDGVTEVRFLKEYCLSNPKNKTESICEAWISDFGAKNYGLFYYGDPSGGNEQTLSRDYRDNYDLLAKKLRPYLNNLSNRVLRTHPSVLLSRDFLNNIFANVYKIRIIIDPSCKELIADLEFCKEDANGKMIKPKKKDENGMTYEARGHALDSKRYLLCALFPDIMRTIRE